MKKMAGILAAALLAVALVGCGGWEETLKDQPMSTTTQNTTAVIRVDGISELTRHLREQGVVWEREEEADLGAVLAGGKAGRRLYHGEKYIEIFLFDMEDEANKDIVRRILERRELERGGEVVDVQWREPFSIYVEDAQQREQVLQALRSY